MGSGKKGDLNMPFVNIKGFPGKVYVPEAPPEAPKKHPCPDCFSCQVCGDDRCRTCQKASRSRTCAIILPEKAENK